MRETGIVRRIDDLGRVVIPKEIRRTLRIKEGDPLEIYTDKDELLFRKYSPISGIQDIVKNVGESLSSVTDKSIIITDTDNVVYASSKYKDCIGKNITKDLEKVLRDRRDLVSSAFDGDRIINVFTDGDFTAQNQIIIPILSNGDCYGCVVYFDDEKNSKLSSLEVNTVKLASKIISKQFE